MLSEETRSRLEQLNRARLPDPPIAAAARGTARSGVSVGLGATGGTSASVLAARVIPVADPSDRTLTSLLPGEEAANDDGRHYVIREPLASFWPEFNVYLERLNVPPPDRQPLSSRRSDRQLLANSFPERTLFLDLETCGLAGAPIFLVGLIRATPDGLVLDQLLARDYSEERAMLASLEGYMGDHDVLVTFNGKSFDWPMVQDRRAFHRLAGGRTKLPHVDLLLHARRRWRTQVPNCRLQTLERFLCRRSRQDDIPGHLIPAAYHAFVRTGDARQLRTILHHNALDLVTLAQLTMRMLAEE